MAVLFNYERVKISGVSFHNVNRMETLSAIDKMISSQERHYICTPNADHIIRAAYDSEFRKIIDNADLVIPDGMAVIYASYILGTPLKQNVGGRLLLPEMVKKSDETGYRIFLLGGSDPSVLEKAVIKLKSSYPNSNIVGYYSPPFMQEFDKRETEYMLQVINKSKPDILFVCLGTPKQEKWIARNFERIESFVSIGVGIALDMIAGNVSVPPRWISNIGFEWLFRLYQEPKRLYKRYLIDDPKFFLWVIKQRLTK